MEPMRGKMTLFHFSKEMKKTFYSYSYFYFAKLFISKQNFDYNYKSTLLVQFFFIMPLAAIMEKQVFNLSHFSTFSSKLLEKET